ncbi:MAG TPA: hypothetical protein VK400_14780, partial [Pyrinomonadaceae bacterium]|nr:hypothetical protein [Pyrinomonadaceae bacterium]
KAEIPDSPPFPQPSSFNKILFRREHRVDFRKQFREGWISGVAFVARARGSDFDESVLAREDIDFRS